MHGILVFVIKNLRRRRLRSWLTIIGIIVGVLAIVSLMSLSQGLKDSITSEFDKLGANKITITSRYNYFGAETNTGLKLNDIKTIKQIGDIDYVVGEIAATTTAEYGGETLFISLKGVDTKYIEETLLQNNIELLKGKLIDSEKSKDIIVGYGYYDDYDNLFKKRLTLGNKVKINNVNYKVVGVLKDTGNATTNKTNYISIDNIRDITSTPDTDVDTIYAIIKDGKEIDVVGAKIEKKLETKRGKEDFVVTTPKKAAEDRENTLNIVSIVVIGIAAISLLVGGIGIMNSMYTSVVERRKEIGIMKAIGAKRKDILSIFLLEAGLIGIIGGFIGTVGGFLLAFMVNVIGKQLGTELAIAFSFDIVLIALCFSFLIGMISGFLPAFQASKQEAIKSLREE